MQNLLLTDIKAVVILEWNYFLPILAAQLPAFKKAINKPD